MEKDATEDDKNVAENKYVRLKKDETDTNSVIISIRADGPWPEKDDLSNK